MLPERVDETLKLMAESKQQPEPEQQLGTDRLEAVLMENKRIRSEMALLEKQTETLSRDLRSATAALTSERRSILEQIRKTAWKGDGDCGVSQTVRTMRDRSNLSNEFEGADNDAFGMATADKVM